MWLVCVLVVCNGVDDVADVAGVCLVVVCGVCVCVLCLGSSGHSY